MTVTCSAPRCASEFGRHGDSNRSGEPGELGLIGSSNQEKTAADKAHPLATGDHAPDFIAIAQTGAKVKLSDFSRKPILLVFYDHDGSAASKALFEALATEWLHLQPALGIILALGPESAIEHAAYASDARWPILLASDPEHEIARAYRVESDAQLPAAFVVDVDTRIRFARYSAEPAFIVELKQALSRRASP